MWQVGSAIFPKTKLWISETFCSHPEAGPTVSTSVLEDTFCCGLLMFWLFPSAGMAFPSFPMSRSYSASVEILTPFSATHLSSLGIFSSCLCTPGQEKGPPTPRQELLPCVADSRACIRLGGANPASGGLFRMNLSALGLIKEAGPLTLSLSVFPLLQWGFLLGLYYTMKAIVQYFLKIGS